MKDGAKVTGWTQVDTGTCTWCALKPHWATAWQTETAGREHVSPPPLMREEKSLCRGRTLDVNYWTTSDSIKSRYSLHRETLKKEVQGHAHKQIPECLEIVCVLCLKQTCTAFTWPMQQYVKCHSHNYHWRLWQWSLYFICVLRFCQLWGKWLKKYVGGFRLISALSVF